MVVHEHVYITLDTCLARGSNMAARGLLMVNLDARMRADRFGLPKIFCTEPRHLQNLTVTSRPPTAPPTHETTCDPKNHNRDALRSP